MIHNRKSNDLGPFYSGLSFFKKHYIIFPKNYNFLEKYMSLCYTTSRLIYGENR